MSQIITIILDGQRVNYFTSDGIEPTQALAAVSAVKVQLEGQVVEARAKAMLAAMKAEEEEDGDALETTAHE